MKRVGRKREAVWALIAAEVEGGPDSEVQGAYVNIAVVAFSRGEAVGLAEERLAELGFTLIRAEEVGELKRLRLATRRMSQWQARAKRARRTGVAQLGPFYTWPGDSED